MDKILIIEDEKSINRFIRINLEREGFKVACAFSGEEGLEMTRQFKPEVLVLDIMLPGIDGFEVCTIIRELNPYVIIIMLTAKGQDMDKIMGLELGADGLYDKTLQSTGTDCKDPGPPKALLHKR